MAVGGHSSDLVLTSLHHPAPDHHVVYVWMSVGTQQFGHSSFLLSNGDYVSWWPKGRKMKCGPMSKVGDCSMDLQEDIEKETFEPDYTFCIPHGDLDVTRMSQYWSRWRERGHYKLLNRNCCSMVYKVLHKGGAPRSLTIVWRPETLRRYLVIYLGGGSKYELFWNMPRWDEPYKESHTLYVWKDGENGHGHASLCLAGQVYISWWPFIQSEVDDEVSPDWVDVQHGSPSSTWEEDIRRTGRADDIKITFRPKNLDLCEMKRRWKKFIEEDKKELWGANSFWLIYEILLAGGAPACNKVYDYWNGETLEKYIMSNYTVVQD